MQELEAALQETTGGSTELLAMLERGIAAGIITKEQAASLKAMNANSKTSSSSQD
jgi:hypothetical protein